MAREDKPSPAIPLNREEMGATMPPLPPPAQARAG